MTAFFHDIARAALPVAIGLLILTALARALPLAQIDDPRVKRIASEYLGPLSTWCLIAVGVYTLALGLGGDASLVAFVPPVALGLAAALLRPATEPGEHAPASTPARREPPAAPVPEPARREPAAAPEPGGALWARQREVSGSSQPRLG